MANERTNIRGDRCPRCRARATVQNAVELRPGVNYLTLRCIACGLVFDAQTGAEIPASADRADTDCGPISPK